MVIEAKVIVIIEKEAAARARVRAVKGEAHGPVMPTATVSSAAGPWPSAARDPGWGTGKISVIQHLPVPLNCI